MSESEIYDALIIGGGPGGATAGLLLARAGLRALIIEKTSFPRFRIGESLLPRNGTLLRELGLENAMRRVPHVPKLGGEFAMGHELQSTCFSFDQGLLPGGLTYNVERAAFDAMLLNEARKAGAEVRENVAVKSIGRLADGDVAVTTDEGEITARYLLDASGQSTVVARHLNTRRAQSDAVFKKVAYFAHFENVRRHEGEQGGYPFIAMCEEGWFWIIAIDATRTSVGLVVDAELSRRVDVPANRMLAWGIERCPAVRERMVEASGPELNQTIADFSYTCRPYAGPGYFLLGDAAAFLDPIFSTGVCLSMMSAREAAQHVTSIVQHKIPPARARKQYIAFIDQSTGVYFKLIRQYYQHSFRELFLNGRGPMRVHSAVLAILAGHVFPKPPLSLRWRLRFFDFFVWLNQHLQLVPSREHFSLLKTNTMTCSTDAEIESLDAAIGVGNAASSLEHEQSQDAGG